MTIHGSTLSFPLRADDRGTLACVSDPVRVIAEAIRDIIETSPGERVAMPEYGIADLIFEVVDAGYKYRLAYQLREQIMAYVPGVESLEIEVHDAEPERVSVSLRFQVRGSNVPGNLVYPLWQLREEADG